MLGARFSLRLLRCNLRSAGSWPISREEHSLSGGCQRHVEEFRRLHAILAQGSRRVMHAAAGAQKLESIEDKYNGVQISAEKLPQDRTLFSELLDKSLEEWAQEGKRGIWLRLSLTQVSLMETAILAGFSFHHVEHGNLVLSKWLPKDLPNKLPEGATHQVGIGAFLLNEKREVLLVQEGWGVLRGQGVWKLPTGLSNLGEDVVTAAEREVREETGIKARFDRVLAIRQSHGHNFGRSDLFFVCGMKLDGSDQKVVLQRDELVAADWHPLDEVERLPIFQSGPLFKSIFASCKAYADGSYAGLQSSHLAHGRLQRTDLLFSM